jgi:hypothetical protein
VKENGVGNRTDAWRKAGTGMRGNLGRGLGLVRRMRSRLGLARHGSVQRLARKRKSLAARVAGRSQRFRAQPPARLAGQAPVREAYGGDRPLVWAGTQQAVVRGAPPAAEGLSPGEILARLRAGSADQSQASAPVAPARPAEVARAPKAPPQQPGPPGLSTRPPKTVQRGVASPEAGQSPPRQPRRQPLRRTAVELDAPSSPGVSDRIQPAPRPPVASPEQKESERSRPAREPEAQPEVKGPPADAQTRPAGEGIPAPDRPSEAHPSAARPEVTTAQPASDLTVQAQTRKAAPAAKEVGVGDSVPVAQNADTSPERAAMRSVLEAGAPLGPEASTPTAGHPAEGKTVRPKPGAAPPAAAASRAPAVQRQKGPDLSSQRRGAKDRELDRPEAQGGTTGAAEGIETIKPSPLRGPQDAGEEFDLALPLARGDAGSEPRPAPEPGAATPSVEVQPVDGGAQVARRASSEGTPAAQPEPISEEAKQPQSSVEPAPPAIPAPPGAGATPETTGRRRIARKPDDSPSLEPAPPPATASRALALSTGVKPTVAPGSSPPVAPISKSLRSLPVSRPARSLQRRAIHQPEHPSPGQRTMHRAARSGMEVHSAPTRSSFAGQPPITYAPPIAKRPTALDAVTPARTELPVARRTPLARRAAREIQRAGEAAPAKAPRLDPEAVWSAAAHRQLPLARARTASIQRAPAEPEPEMVGAPSHPGLPQTSAVIQREAEGPGPAESPVPAAGEAEAAPAAATRAREIEIMAQAVHQILRRRLRVEQERALGWAR